MVKHGSLRASDADREQIIDRLRKAAAEGRLAADELETRVTTALRARTYAQLDATVCDLPVPGRIPATGPSAAGWAVSTVRARPVLLFLAIPLGLVVAATVIALTTIWAMLMVVMFVLGHRGPVYRGPWSYGTRGRHARFGRYGPPTGRYGANGRFVASRGPGQSRGYSA